jgi:hypothetical protein
MVILGDRMERSPATFRDLAPGKYPLRMMLPDFIDETELSVAQGRVCVRRSSNWRGVFPHNSTDRRGVRTAARGQTGAQAPAQR